jgi:hypothetical protein
MRKTLSLLVPLLVSCTRPIASSTVGSSNASATSSGTTSQAAASAAATTTATTRQPDAASPEESLAWGTRPPAKSDFYPIADGMCIHARVWPLDDAVALTYGQAIANGGGWSRGGAATAVLLDDDGVKPTTDLGFGKGLDTVAQLGGTKDRLWAILSRGGGRFAPAQDYLGFGNTVSGGFEDALPKQPDKAYQRFVFRDTDGSFVFTTLDANVPEYSADAKGNTVRTIGTPLRINREGQLVKNSKFPGNDTLGGVVFVRKDGELFALGRNKIVRWSPTKPVSDIPLNTEDGEQESEMGEHTFFVSVGAKIYRIDNETPKRSKLTRASARSSAVLRGEAPARLWAVGSNESLIAIHDEVMRTEAADGTVTERSAPPRARMIGFARGVLWLVAAGTKTDRDETFYIDRNGEWIKQSLPAPPFGSRSRGPFAIEYVTVSAPDDIQLNVRYLESGLGWKQPEPYRAIYRSKRPKEVMRCGDVRKEATGIGFWPSPPTADATCTHATLLLTQDPTPLPTNYPDVASYVRGNKAFGDKATFMNIPWQGQSYLALTLPNVAVGEELGKRMSKALDLRTKVFCGTPKATRTFTMDVATGKFTF